MQTTREKKKKRIKRERKRERKRKGGRIERERERDINHEKKRGDIHDITYITLGAAMLTVDTTVRRTAK